MSKEGKYIYCIINGNEGRNFGPIGIGKRDDIVSTIGFNDISAVISSSPISQYVIDPENLMAHEKVIEAVMKDYGLACQILHHRQQRRGGSHIPEKTVWGIQRDAP